MIAASLGFFFVTATTFTSLGYVLYTMVAELHWSQTAAGMSFALLGLACGLSSPLPPQLMKAVGTRLTMTIGALVLAAGFALAGTIDSLYMFFLATTLMGIGFSLIAPAPAVYLLATWFPEKSSRMIGFYFMSGAAGGIAGPLIVGSIVGLTGSWRTHWMVMAGCSVALAVICFVAIRDAVKVESAEQVRHAGAKDEGPVAASAWTVKRAMMTPAFAVLALAMAVVQTVVTTCHAMLVSHVASMGLGASAGAVAMSLLAAAGTLSKGVTGALCEKYPPVRLLVGGLALQSVAMLGMWSGGSVLMVYASALLFGIGWGVTWLSAHILLVRYYGAAIAGDMTAMATMMTTVAVLGPVIAGRVADVTGHYNIVFLAFAGMLGLATIVSALFLRAPEVVGAVVPEGEAALAAE
ncbi:MFS transporter [Sandaracinobacter neustonicus]|uniref:MFS transporter n=2 Tax=Sandaracinobacter neustonicus TaxID=1715348 RepID=A0A501XP82_9SPHN|nr:MFS transporter [Sandaracinobacter neustonicus]